MNPKSASTLVWAAVIVNLLGLVVMSPSGQFILAAVGGVVAIVPTVFGRKLPRIAGAVVLLVSIGLVVVAYPKHEQAMQQYQQRAQERSAKPPPTAPTQPAARK